MLSTIYLNSEWDRPSKHEVGSRVLVIGVKGAGRSDLESFLVGQPRWKLITRYPELANNRYLLTGPENHILQPALLERVK